MEALKTQLDQHDDEITNIEDANKEISDVANDKILELKAMVNNLHDASKLVVDTAGFKGSIHGLESALNKTSTQCLASVQVKSFKDGVISMACELVNEHESNFIGGEIQIAAIAQVVINENKSKG
jgi:hypothetical protein